MEWILVINIIESVLLSWFISSLLDVKNNKGLYRVLLFSNALLLISVSNYNDMYDMFLSSFVIVGSIAFSLIFVSNGISEILFICCLEALLGCCSITIAILLCSHMNNQIIDVVGKSIYLIMGIYIIMLIKKEHLVFHKNFYYGLSLIIYILHFLIQHLLQMYLIINVKNIDFLISFGLLIFCILALLFSLVYISKLYKDRGAYHELLIEKRNEEVLSYLYNEVKITKHDLKHDYSLIKHYIDENDLESINQMINQKNQIIEDIPSLIDSKNLLLNTIVNNKIIEAYAKEIKVQCRISVDGKISIIDYDLNQLLSNMLDNAIENCVIPGEIDIQIIQENEFLHIQISNSIMYSAIKNDLETRKDKKYHGFGLKSIQNICHKYHGNINIKEENNRFYIETTLFLEI